jgi:hypothetical protein
MLEENCWNKKNLYYERGMLRKETHRHPLPHLCETRLSKVTSKSEQDSTLTTSQKSLCSTYDYIISTSSSKSQGDRFKKREKNQIPELMEHDFIVNNGI